MRIAKCPKCNKYLLSESECYYCGNTSDFEFLSMRELHFNAASDYEQLDKLLNARKFDEVLKLVQRVLEWIPDLATAFWIRLLAKNKCSTATELICFGFNCETDSDFCNAFSYSSGFEHQAFVQIKEVVLAARKKLSVAIVAHDKQRKIGTNIVQVRERAKTDIEQKRDELFAIWVELQEVEHSLDCLDKNCRLIIKEHETSIQMAAHSVLNIRNKTSSFNECHADTMHELQVKLGEALQQSEAAKDAIVSMKNHPWVKSFNELVTTRDQLVKKIEAALSSLNNYEQGLERTILTFNGIDKLHTTALSELTRFRFGKSAALLGLDAFSEVLAEAGLSLKSLNAGLNTVYSSLAEASSSQAVNASLGSDWGYIAE